MSFSREQWCRSVLSALGNTRPAVEILDFLVGWTAFEVLANSGPKYNLLATTLKWNHSTSYNDVGVQNYETYADGVAANVATLQNNYYPSIFSCLKGNYEKEISPNVSPAILAELDIWCGRCRASSPGYGPTFISSASSHRGDKFDYGSPHNPPQPLPTPHQKKEALDCWQSHVQKMHGVSLAVDTGIYKSWIYWWLQGHFLGCPVTPEYKSNDWSGDEIIVQEFSCSRCEWRSGKARWYGPAGLLFDGGSF